MKNFIYFLIFSFGLLSCEKKSKLKGVWYAAYYKTNDGKSRVYEKMLWDFSDKTVYYVQFGDLSTGDNSKLIVDSSNYDYNGTTLTLNEGVANLIYHKDSIIVSQKGLNKTLVLKRISNEFKNINPKTNLLKGSYIISGKSYTDSLSFINDSVFIFTGQYHRNFPIYNWEIINYKGFSFFNIHDSMFPMALIKTWSENELVMKLTPNDFNQVLVATNNIDKSELLFGDWLEIHEEVSENVHPGNVWERANPFSLYFEIDSLTISRFGRSQTYSWDLTSDSKRIYFKDKILREDGSWKILYLTKDKLSIRMSTHQGASEKVIKLKRQNGR